MPKINAPTLGQHRSETVDRLLDAFGELVMERGFADLSLAVVAAKAKLARTAIYTYFPDKEAILFGWTEREVNRTIEQVASEVEGAKSYSAKLAVFINLQLKEFSARHLPPGREVIQFLQPETYERFMAHIEPLEKILQGIIEEGTQAGEFGEVDAESSVAMVMACIGAERVPLAKGSHKIEDSAKRVTDFVLRALAPA